MAGQALSGLAGAAVTVGSMISSAFGAYDNSDIGATGGYVESDGGGHLIRFTDENGNDITDKVN